jgi:hypothetical protein
MSLPPQPGPWQPSQPSTPPSAQGQQPQGHQYYGPPPPGYQQPWYPPPRPPKKNSSMKWVILGGVALVAVIAVAVAVTVAVLQPNSGGGSKRSAASTTAPAAGIASANDKGPVTVITEDASCAPWTPIQNTIADSEQNGWEKRDPSIPASAWTQEQRAQYQAVGTAMRSAADQTVAVAKLTPHRVMRELYEQAVVYWRAYADSILHYAPRDDYQALVANSIQSALGAICAAITYGSAAARGPLVVAQPAPSHTASLTDPGNPQRLLSSPNPVCTEWNSALDQFGVATAAWRKLDPNIPASQWTPDQRAVNDAVRPVMTASADKFEQLGRRSDNPTLEDFAVLASEYRRAFVQAVPTYVAADNYLADTANYATGSVSAACKAAEE